MVSAVRGDGGHNDCLKEGTSWAISGGEGNKEEGEVPPLSMEVSVPLTMPATFTSCSADDRARKGGRSVSASNTTTRITLFSAA